MGVFQKYVKTDKEGRPILGKDGKPIRFGFWFMQYPYARDPVTGKIKYKTAKASHSKKVAENMLRAKENEFFRSEHLGYAVPRDMDFGEFMDWGLGQEVMQAKASASDDKARVAYLKAHFGNCKAAQVTPLMVDNFRVTMRKSGHSRSGRALSGTTVNKLVSLARRIYYLAMDAGIVTSNPFARRGLFKEHPAGKYIPDAELRSVLGHLPEHLKPIVLTAYLTGMRSGELINLTWDRVDLSKGIIDLNPKDTKTEEPRLIYFGVLPELRNLFAVMDRIRRNKANLVFIRADGKPWINWSVSYYFAAANRKAEVGPYRFHDLRHTFNSNMLKAGVEQAIIMKLTGHKTVSMFLRYSHVDHEQSMDAMAKMRDRMVPDQGGQTQSAVNPSTAYVLPG